MNWIKVRIKATGQVLDMLPSAARAMVAGGTAELVGDSNSSQAQPQTAAIEPRNERAIAPQASARRPRKRRPG